MLVVPKELMMNEEPDTNAELPKLKTASALEPVIVLIPDIAVMLVIVIVLATELLLVKVSSVTPDEPLEVSVPMVNVPELEPAMRIFRPVPLTAPMERLLLPDPSNRIDVFALPSSVAVLPSAIVPPVIDVKPLTPVEPLPVTQIPWTVAPAESVG